MKGKKSNKHEGKPDGRVGRLDESTIGYYRRVSDTLKQGFEEEDEKSVFLRNVFNELKEHELEIARNQTASHILEDLLQYADPTQVEDFIRGITKDIETAVHDRFACHVVQASLSKAGLFIQSGQNSPSLSKLIVQISKTFLEFIEDVIIDTYASHVLKTIFEVLSGTKVLEEVARSRLSRSQQKGKLTTVIKEDQQELPEEFMELLNSFITRIKELPNLSELLLNPIASTVLEALLLVLKSKDDGRCQKLCKLILKRCSAVLQKPESSTQDSKLPLLMVDTIGSHLLEVLIQVSSEKAFCKLFKVHFSGHLIPIALHPIANHVVQTVLQKVNTEEQLVVVFDEMHGHFEDLLAVNHVQVLQHLADACFRLSSKQKQFIEALLMAFHCFDPRSKQISCVPLFSSLKTHDIYYGNGEDGNQKPASISFNIQGSLLIQKMLKFKHCKTIIGSFLAMTPDDLISMACDSCGSHIVDAFLQSKAVGEKKRERFVEKLKGNFVKLSCDKNGSRTIDTIWKIANLKIRFNIIEELAPKDRILQSDRFGRFIYRNLAIELFKKKKNEWKELQNGNIRKQRMLEELITETPSIKGKDKEVKKTEELQDSNDEATQSKEGMETTTADDQIGQIFDEISKKKKSKHAVIQEEEVPEPKKKKKKK
ncbi:nucleolar protein 9-like [Anneissia japonica]|uniref:nucleolar protein 9-like n=1 Tax=Anneissia japonica TaxID=1529436 RepID=UPI0014257C66|nr:nucleolar protein 9-like [Anneissia japonica]